MASDASELLAQLHKACAIMLLLLPGPPVNSVRNDLLAHLGPEDLTIDPGNSSFRDTDIRARELPAKDIQVLGAGVSRA